MSSGTSASPAVRQIEYWYKHYLDSYVQEVRSQSSATPGRPAAITGAVVAQAHEQAWRHGIVRASQSTNAQDWSLLTVADESTAYRTLLTWAADKYRLNPDDVAEAQSSQGYRHHPR